MTNLFESPLSNDGRADIHAEETARFMQRVYCWMTVALIVSGATAFYVSMDTTLYTLIFSKGLFLPLIFLELGLAIGLSWLINKMSANVAVGLFLLYSFVTGLTLSVIFAMYKLDSIVSIFGVSALIFGAMSFYGYYTKKDLTGIGTLAFFGLIGVIIAGLINMWIGSSMANTIIAIIGVIVFIALTAYDTQKIKSMNIIGNEGTEEDTKEAVIGALTLYLDFINLFLKLLQLFGSRK